MEKVTYHGSQRIVDRTHCTRANVDAEAARIWSNGKKISDISDKRFIDWIQSHIESSDREFRIHGENAYIYNACGKLITVLIIPKKVMSYLGENARKKAKYYVSDIYEETDDDKNLCDKFGVSLDY